MEAFFRKCLIQGPVLSQTYSTLNLGQTDIAPIKKKLKKYIYDFHQCSVVNLRWETFVTHSVKAWQKYGNSRENLP